MTRDILPFSKEEVMTENQPRDVLSGLENFHNT